MLDRYYCDNRIKEKQMLSQILKHIKDMENFLEEL